MTIETFKSSLSASKPPEGIPILLKALWHSAKNDWETAHNLAQDIHSAEGSWIHAHLHRVEGDQGNADYWYRRAGKPVPRVAVEKEWEDIVITLLANK